LDGGEYLKEASLSRRIEAPPFIFELDGRADGIIIKKNGRAIVEEIKSTTRPIETVEPLAAHWAQAKCYAFMLGGLPNGLPNGLPGDSPGGLIVRLTYINVETDDTKEFEEHITGDEAETFTRGVAERYAAFAAMIDEITAKRDESAKELPFPFDGYRENQRRFAGTVYRTILKGEKLFAQAPTGTGKTISTLFPAVKALAENHADKIFYVTAKTITRGVAEEALDLMAKKGLDARSVTLTAKEKICFHEKTACYPEGCACAKGHFDRVNAAILDILRVETVIKRETVETYAKRHNVCPFEFSLDITTFADIIICDYNYVYDPSAGLRRFFSGDSGDRIVVLHDEAHNLVDRAREMYSAALSKTAFTAARKDAENAAVRKALSKITRLLDGFGDGILFTQKPPPELFELLQAFCAKSGAWMAQNPLVTDRFLDLYFSALDFSRAMGFYDERFVFCSERENRDVTIKIICLDPSRLLAKTQKNIKAAVFFSATLTPAEYFIRSLGGDEGDLALRFPSPFPRANLCLLVDGTISTLYKNREASLLDVADRLYKMVSGKHGNYMAFFPSYAYMRRARETFETMHPDVTTVEQTPNMTESEREQFLNRFAPGGVLLVFAALGGMFAEGVDLAGERLVGAAVVGVGLPLITPERGVMRDYYDAAGLNGFDYAYTYPGFNKVLQAAGRVIRSSGDRGVVLLIDARFLRRDYINMFPPEWTGFKRVNAATTRTALRSFWNG
jgi:Rad3-related DNA helicase